jgi:hypothetical protein
VPMGPRPDLAPNVRPLSIPAQADKAALRPIEASKVAICNAGLRPHSPDDVMI